MQNKILIFCFLCIKLTYSQIDSNYTIMEIIYLNKITDTLVQKFDENNPKNLIRLDELDSAAKHHVKYLILHYIETDSLTHREYHNYPNFEEKVKPEDRTGFKNLTSEICHVSENSHVLDNAIFSKIFTNSNNVLANLARADILYFNHKRIFKGYKNSPSHWSIITDRKNKYFGSCTAKVIYKCRFNSSHQPAVDRFFNLRIITYNVTNFVAEH